LVPERLLLETVFVIEHPDVDEDLAVFIARVSLVLDAHPTVALVGSVEIARRDGVGECYLVRAHFGSFVGSDFRQVLHNDRLTPVILSVEPNGFSNPSD
jgi:hypothetical protein